MIEIAKILLAQDVDREEMDDYLSAQNA